MSTTFGALKTAVAAALKDPSNQTFSASAIGDMVNEAISEVSRIEPMQFQEDITPVADTLEYIVLSDMFSAEAQPEIEIARVELWDGGETPNKRLYVVEPASAGLVADSQTGWLIWGGTLYLPRYVWSSFNGHEDTYLIRVWGYCPYQQCTTDDEVVNMTAEPMFAVQTYARLIGLERLLSERELFSQWQTRSGNTDISPAALMNALGIARDEWRRRSRALSRLRSAV